MIGCAVVWLGDAAVASYVVVGLGGFWLLRDIVGVDPSLANRIAITAFVAAIPLIALSPLLLLRGQGPTTVDVTFGSAAFMNAVGVKRLTQGSGLIVGRDPKTARLIRYAGDAHLLTVAPTRSGKGVGAIIPNLLAYEDPVLCIDPKGENAHVTARRRRAFGPAHVLDPFGVSGQATSAYNPLAAIDALSPDAADDAAMLADTLVYDPPSQVSEAHWNEEAKALIAGIVLHIVSGDPPSEQALGGLRELLTLPPRAFASLLDAMSASSAVDGLVARAANRHLGKASREAAGVLSAAQRHTHFLDSTRILRATARSDFRLDDLAATNASLFLVLPPDRLATYNRWLRLLVGQALDMLARAHAQPDRPVVFLLDEFASLGRMEAVARAMALMAGMG